MPSILNYITARVGYTGDNKRCKDEGEEMYCNRVKRLLYCNSDNGDNSRKTSHVIISSARQE